MTRRPNDTPKNKSQQPPLYTIGVLADTHIPDRVNELHPLIFQTLRAAGVTHIFHAGDICSPHILTQLGEIAPVTAVRGNRDLFVPGIPTVARIELGGVVLGLVHGHGGVARYLIDKVKFMVNGYNLHRYLKPLIHTFPEAHIIIFGHTHFPEVLWRQGKLLFNPGSASFGSPKIHAPSIGLIRIYEDGQFQPNIRVLKGYKVIRRRWVKTRDLVIE